MGSFDFTCSVSNLPISHGTKVRWLAMGDSRYDNIGCNIHSFYSPIAIPIKAEYNDYGSIDKYNEKSIGYIANLAILNRHAVECGTGDNSCHDVPVLANMSFDKWLNAIWEGRVFCKPKPINRNAPTYELSDE